MSAKHPISLNEYTLNLWEEIQWFLFPLSLSLSLVSFSNYIRTKRCFIKLLRRLSVCAISRRLCTDNRAWSKQISVGAKENIVERYAMPLIITYHPDIDSLWTYRRALARHISTEGNFWILWTAFKCIFCMTLKKKKKKMIFNFYIYIFVYVNLRVRTDNMCFFFLHNLFFYTLSLISSSSLSRIILLVFRMSVYCC